MSHLISQRLLSLLPDEVPIPEPDQWCEEMTFNGTGCCLLGWCSVVLKGTPRYTASGNNPNVTYNDVEELAAFVCGRQRQFGEVTAWNDRDTSREERSKVWRKKIRELGYRIR